MLHLKKAKFSNPSEHSVRKFGNVQLFSTFIFVEFQLLPIRIAQIS